MRGDYEDTRIRKQICKSKRGEAILTAFESVVKEVSFHGKKGQYDICQPHWDTGREPNIVLNCESIDSLIEFMAGALWFRNTFGFQKRKGEDIDE